MYGEVEADAGANEWNRRLATFIIIVAEKQKHTEKKSFETRSKGIKL